MEETSRLWLTFPSQLITKPILHEVGHQFTIITNIRQASITAEVGIICVEFKGSREEIKKAIIWLENEGVTVEPVEINTIEG